VRNNVILAAILAYEASEDDKMTSREVRVPVGRNGEPTTWPTPRDATRRGGLDQ